MSTKKNVLIITHSIQNGINERQSTECANVIGFDNKIVRRINPTEVTREDVLEADKIVMIVPEWNCSFPWSFKKMIDDSGYPSYFANKQIFIVGTSTTTFGNIVGINHLTHIFDWLGAHVLERVCVPRIDEKFANDDIQVDERLNKALVAFIDC
jgi:NAD(P)H-dependent FMN reductase